MAVNLCDPLDSLVSATVRDSRALAATSRLTVALFVALEEATHHIAGALVPHAPAGEPRQAVTQQALDDACHHEVFARRLGSILAAGPGTLRRQAKEVATAVVLPPLRSFLARCQALADRGSFAEALTLLNLSLKGRAVGLYAGAARYWNPVDPGLARLLERTAGQEARHGARAIQVLRLLLAAEPHRRPALAALCADADAGLREVFRYYLRRFVGTFRAALGRHADLFTHTEFAPGRPFTAASDEEQIHTLQAGGDAEYARLLADAGLCRDGQPQPLPHP
jgi:hypothetical protein